MFMFSWLSMGRGYCRRRSRQRGNKGDQSCARRRVLECCTSYSCMHRATSPSYTIRRLPTQPARQRNANGINTMMCQLQKPTRESRLRGRNANHGMQTTAKKIVVPIIALGSLRNGEICGCEQTETHVATPFVIRSG